MRYYVAWLSNTTDRRDDMPLKIIASSVKEATKVAAKHLENRFLIRNIYTMKEFKRMYPWWHAQLWGTKAINESKN